MIGIQNHHHLAPPGDVPPHFFNNIRGRGIPLKINNSVVDRPGSCIFSINGNDLPLADQIKKRSHEQSAAAVSRSGLDNNIRLYIKNGITSARRDFPDASGRQWELKSS